MGDIELGEEDIAFLLEQLRFAKRVSNQSFARKMISKGSTDPEVISKRTEGIRGYNERIDKLISKFQGDKCAKTQA